MSFLEFMHHNVLWLSGLLSITGIVLLVSSIRNVIRVRAESQILSVPPAEEQFIEFNEAGRVVLYIEGPLFSRRFAKAGFELAREDGTPITGRTTWFHAQSSSLSRARMEMRAFEIPMPGRYTLRITNLGPPQARDSDHRVGFTKPHLARAIAYVVAIVLSSMAFITGLVFFLLCVLGEFE